MKKFSLLLMAGLMALGFGACSDEVNVSGGEEKFDGDVYMSFKLELPSSRSQTDTDGTTNSNAQPDYEVGKDYENTVGSIQVVLASENEGQYTKLATSEQGSLVGDGTNYTVTFQDEDIEELAGTENVFVFVFCNKNDITDWFDGMGAAEDGDLTKDNGIAVRSHFLMTNAELTKVAKIPENLASYNSASNPFDLGVVKVERTAARFDYKSGAVGDSYLIQNAQIVNDVQRPSVSIKLTDMALINVSKYYYWLRRVAPALENNTSYNSNEISICEKEVVDNFVVDTDAAEKLANDHISYLYPLTMDGEKNLAPTEFTYTPFSKITEDDNWTGEDGYKIWRYATENTMPSVDSQVNKYSTGVVFKGKMVLGEETGAINLLPGDGAKVYVFNNVLYGTWTQVKNAAELANNDGTLVDPVLNAAYQIIEQGDTEPEKADAVKVGFTVYEPNDDNEYEVYYYYWNRHNDNNENNSMGIMEFAVVRNNVYKLSVTKIHKFGHPGEPTGDPDTPDEGDEVYFRVGVQVVPWVVRVNNIEF